MPQAGSKAMSQVYARNDIPRLFRLLSLGIQCNQHLPSLPTFLGQSRRFRVDGQGELNPDNQNIVPAFTSDNVKNLGPLFMMAL
jgi:hypothetical protein